MEIHHTKHHQAYVTNFNSKRHNIRRLSFLNFINSLIQSKKDAVESLDAARGANDVAKMISLQSSLTFNGSQDE